MKNNLQNQEIANRLLQEYGLLSTARATFESHWEEIAQRVVPSHMNMFRNHQNAVTPGQKKTQYLFDSTAAVALSRFGAILDSMLTPRNQKWHRVMPIDNALTKNRQIRLWFDDLNNALFRYRYAPQANFSSQNQQNYLSLGAYGTGAMYVDDLIGTPGTRYRNVFLGEVHFAENHQGIIDKAFRHFVMTARQMVQKWPDSCPETIKVQLQTNPEKEFLVLHAVIPREDADFGRADFKGMPFASYYVAKEGTALLSEGGYRTFPYAISRYFQFAPEVYGRSPAMDVLPSIKTLNEMKKTQLKAGHRIVDPVLLVHDDGIIDQFSLRPGAINYGGVSADGRPLVHTLPTGNYQVGKEQMEEERNLINDAFLVTLFQILVETPTMSATEVLERTREKGILLAPTVGRQQSEYLGPMVEREVDCLTRQGLLPPMPLVMRKMNIEYKIEYDSPMSRAQRSEEAAGLMRTIETALNVVQTTQDPTPLDYFNWDVIMPEVADIQGVPEKWLNSFDQVQAIRAGRQKNAETQQLIQGGPAAAAMVKAAGTLQKTA